MALKPGPKSQRVSKLLVAGTPVQWIEEITQQPLYSWQKEVLTDLSGEKRPRVAYVQVPRKNGKTRLAAVLALVEVCFKKNRHVYCISDSERNLNSVLIREIRDIITTSPYLQNSIYIFKNHIEVPETNSFIETRPNNFKASQGINPHLVLFDEIHLQKSDDIWSGMQMAGAAREDALIFGITTPGYDLTGLAHTLYQQVKAGDANIYGRIYESDPAANIDELQQWKKANPCFDRPNFLEAMKFDRQVLPEHEFRRFRLGQWTATESAWLPYGAWDNLSDPRGLPDEGTKVWLGFDGSFSGDSTALVGVTDDGYIFVVGCWENPGKKDWRVPREEVDAAVTAAMEQWDVQELLCDPPYWGREISEWSARWPKKVVEFQTYSRSRMAPACTTFYSAIMEKKIRHDGDSRLTRHVSNAIVKPSPQGDYITKPDPMSPAKIDLAVAAVIAYSRASIFTRPRAKLVVL